MAPGCLSAALPSNQQKTQVNDLVSSTKKYTNLDDNVITSTATSTSTSTNLPSETCTNLLNTNKCIIFVSYDDEINLDQIPLPSYPQPTSQQQQKVTEIETINSHKKQLTKASTLLASTSSSSSIDTIDSFEILEQTIMKQKRLARLKNTDLRKKILLKRTFDLVCEIMDHENSIEDEEDDDDEDKKSSDDDEEEEDEEEVEDDEDDDEDDVDEDEENTSNVIYTKSGNIDSDSESESDSSDEEEADDEDDESDSNHMLASNRSADTCQDEEKVFKKILKKYEKEMTNDQLIPKQYMYSIEHTATGKQTSHSKILDKKLVLIKNKKAELNNQELLIDSTASRSDEIYLNILSDDDLAEFNFDSALFIPYESSELTDQTTTTTTPTSELSQQQLGDDKLNETTVAINAIINDQSIFDDAELNGGCFKRTYESGKLKRRLSNSDDDEEEDDEENENINHSIEYNDQQLFTFSSINTNESNCYIYNTSSNSSNLKRHHPTMNHGDGHINDLDYSNSSAKKLKTY